MTDFQLKDCIKEFVRIRAGDVQDNSGNWRLHPAAQQDALSGVLKQIGIADALLAYNSPRNGGKLTLINGHLRKSLDPDIVWPVLILDLTDDEADLLLAVFDPITQMANMDAEAVLKLQEKAKTDEWAVRELLRQQEREANALLSEGEEPEKNKKDTSGPDEMELLPFEHYDYVLVMFKNELDWLAAIEIMGLERRSDPRRTGKVGLSHVIDGARFVSFIRDLQAKAGQPVPVTGGDDESSNTE